MSNTMCKAAEIADGIYAVGATDANETRFHGYHVNRGVTYNAYLIKGNNGKFTLVDTVRKEQSEQLVSKIRSVTDPKNIETVIINHTEPDHSGAFPEIMKLCDPAVYATAAAAKFLKNMFGADASTVKNGDQVSIGGRTYVFAATPMVHWPDNMVTYLPAEKILFSNDAFGQHYASKEVFDTLSDVNVALEEATHYFANIVMPYRAQAAKAVQAVKTLKLDMIAPSHGTIWTEHIPDILKLYDALCSGQGSDATLVYDSMWGGTAQRADEALAELGKRYQSIKSFDLRNAHMSDVMAALSASKHVCIGSPTYNSRPTPRISTLLAEIEALAPPLKEYSIFGTFGWGGGASKKISEKLDALGLEKTFDLTRIS